MAWDPPQMPGPGDQPRRSAIVERRPGRLDRRSGIVLAGGMVAVGMVVIGALSDRDSGSTREQRICADYILAGDDWQNGRITDGEMRGAVRDAYYDSGGTAIEEAFANLLATMTTDGADAAVPQMRSLATRCGNLLPD